MKPTALALLLSGFAVTSAGAAPAPLPIVGIAHVAFQSSNLHRSRVFYSGVLGYELAFKTAAPDEAWYFKINDDQFFKLVPVPAADDDRLVEVAMEVADAARTAALLRGRGLEPAPLVTRPDGTIGTTLLDPDGHSIAFVEYTTDSEQVRARGRHLGTRRVSDRLWHTGLLVRDEARARAFYEEKLGCVEIWRGAPEGQPTAWVNVLLPGARGDYLEYMLAAGPVSRERLGSMHHVCLQVDDIQRAHRQLGAQGLPDLERHQPRVGRINRWLLNVQDPDGTRSEFMEPHPASAVVPGPPPAAPLP